MLPKAQHVFDNFVKQILYTNDRIGLTAHITGCSEGPYLAVRNAAGVEIARSIYLKTPSKKLLAADLKTLKGSIDRVCTAW